jgi:hypothetical protein
MLFNGTDDAGGDFKGNGIDDIAIDPATGKLAFITGSNASDAGVVYVGNRDGSGSLAKVVDSKVNGTFGNTTGIGLYGLAAANGKLYLECGDEFVGVINVDGTGAAKVHDGLAVDHESWLYYDIAVDPTTNTLYSLGDTAVWKINLAPNSQLSNIASNKTSGDTFSGERMTLRKATEELFFIDTEKEIVYKAKTDGSNYTPLYTLTGEGYAIVVDEQSGDLYITEDNTIHKFSSGGTKTALLTAKKLGAIAYY